MKKPGIALVEVLVAMGVMALMMPALITAFFSARSGTGQLKTRLLATEQVREAKEALRLVRDAGWENLEAVVEGDPYHPEVVANNWALAAGQETVDPLLSMTREIELLPAYRDGSGNLTSAAAGNTLDPSVKRVLITVSWGSFIPSTVVSDYYLMRFENLTWIQTLVADWEAGVQAGTVVTSTDDGEVVLGSGGAGHADWCEPSLTLVSVDLSGQGVGNDIAAEVGTGSNPNRVVASTGDNSSGLPLAFVPVSNTTPPTAYQDGGFDGYKANGVWVEGNYAYLATDTKAKDVVIVDLTQKDGNGKYVEIGYYDAPAGGGERATTVAVEGGVGYVTVGATFYTFEMSSPVGARPGLSSIVLSGLGARFEVVNGHAYIAESTGSRAIEIVAVANGGSSLSIVGWASISGQNGVEIAVNSTATRGYLATPQGMVYVLDTTAPYAGALPAPLGSFSTNGMVPKGIEVVTNNRAIVVGNGGSLQYQVIDISDETSLNLCTNSGTTAGGLAVPAGVNGIAGVQEEDGDAYAYILTNDSAAEVQVIQGGGGGGGGVYATEGTFETQYFDALRSSTFNRFEATTATPVDTILQFQVGITQPVAGSCEGASYAYVGPDGTAGTWFPASGGTLPWGSGAGYENPGQCLKVKAYLQTSNQNNTPILYDLTVNYSP